jgi:hypothetical protein
MTSFPVRVRAGLCRPTKKEKEDAYDMYVLEDEMTLRVTHLTKHLHVDLYVTDIMRGMRIWQARDEGPALTALSWAVRTRDRRMRVDHLAYPTAVAFGRDFNASVYPDGHVAVRTARDAVELFRFDAAHAVYLSMEAVEPLADERIDDWILRIDNATMDSDGEYLGE